MKNFFSLIYFSFVGLILSITYTQMLRVPEYKALGIIDNNGAISTSDLNNIIGIIYDDSTVALVLEEVGIPENDMNEAIVLFGNNISVTIPNTSSLEIQISYTEKNDIDAISMVETMIDITLSTYHALYSSNEGQFFKQSTPIVISTIGISDNIFHLIFSLSGGVFGALLGITLDLLDGKIILNEDITDYMIPFNLISFKRRKKDDSVWDSPILKEAFLVLEDRILGTARRINGNIIGICNLGNDSFDSLAFSLANNLSKSKNKTLLISQKKESQPSNDNAGIDEKDYKLGVLYNKDIVPKKVDENLYTISNIGLFSDDPFNVEERLNLVRNIAEDFDYVLVEIPPNTKFLPPFFEHNLIDLLLINISFFYTSLNTLNMYLSNIDSKYRNQLFLNAIDSSIKNNFVNLLWK